MYGVHNNQWVSVVHIWHCTVHQDGVNTWTFTFSEQNLVTFSRGCAPSLRNVVSLMQVRLHGIACRSHFVVFHPRQPSNANLKRFYSVMLLTLYMTSHDCFILLCMYVMHPWSLLRNGGTSKFLIWYDMIWYELVGTRSAPAVLAAQPVGQRVNAWRQFAVRVCVDELRMPRAAKQRQRHLANNAARADNIVHN